MKPFDPTKFPAMPWETKGNPDTCSDPARVVDKFGQEVMVYWSCYSQEVPELRWWGRIVQCVNACGNILEPEKAFDVARKVVAETACSCPPDRYGDPEIPMCLRCELEESLTEAP